MQQDKLVAVVEGAGPNALRSARSRRELAARLVHELGLWEPPVYQFVEEMRGLNFFIAEDRLLFIEFARLALHR